MKRLVDIFNAIDGNLENIITGIAFLLLSYFISMFLNRVFNKRFIKNMDNPLLAQFTISCLIVCFFMISLLISLYIIFGKNLVNQLLTSVGLIAIVFGFAFKDIGENFISGLILAIKPPFKIDDYIEIGNILGQVKEFGIRNIVVKTVDGKDVFIPNSSLIKNNLVSCTLDSSLRYGFVVGLEVGVDFDKAKQVIWDAVLLSDKIIKDKKLPNIFIKELTASTTNVQVNFWIFTEDYATIPEHNTIKSEIINNVIKSLLENNFYLPCDVLEIKNYNAESLKTTRASQSQL